MINHFCDRCGKEINGCAFEIHALVLSDDIISETAKSIVDSLSRKDQKYCQDCATEFDKFLKGRQADE